MVLLFVFTIMLLIVYVIYVRIRFNRLRRAYVHSQRDAKKIIRLIRRVRYGKLSESAENLNNKELEEAFNRLIETIVDRESMITEYQLSLSDKNHSLQNMIDAEKESQKFKEDFIATLTHDLKVPVIAELNTLDFLLAGRFGELNDKQIEALTLMKTSNEELIELADILLQTYKVQQNSISLVKSKINIVQFIENIVENMKPIAQNNSQTIILDSMDKTIELNVDKVQLARVFKNLIMNAITFSYHDSKIIVKMDIVGDKMSIQVINSGKGISKEDLELIFNKYYSSAKKFRKMGTGLGLYLSNQIVKAHKGHISVDASQDEITTFTVLLPIS